ncbi:DUF6477 family protein [Pontibaca methylaminivorans]|uniref:Uncharacterized protein n=1 Tax=Pontibaca methylaminivorans TaxID=515897 RepID=A0A1R3W7Q2_9RHOB|nr:DUF6477 family protein [Pontibaca methylaminivorans]SIT73950.1 hypothetical protein SAMN05421849_0071 [Pontibaca methylaminivorans]
MQDVLSMLHALRRPRLLIRTARIGANDYRRTAHLQRLLGYGALPCSRTVLMRLMDMERAAEDARVAGSQGYSLLRHIDLLIAMMGEARLLQAAADSEGSTDAEGAAPAPS